MPQEGLVPGQSRRVNETKKLYLRFVPIHYSALLNGDRRYFEYRLPENSIAFSATTYSARAKN